jgi:large subunit ribosomal protein L35Ae
LRIGFRLIGWTKCLTELFFFFVCSLYTKGRILGHKRGKRNTRPDTSLIQIEGVSNKDETQFYLGKVRPFLSDS